MFHLHNQQNNPKRLLVFNVFASRINPPETVSTDGGAFFNPTTQTPAKRVRNNERRRLIVLICSAVVWTCLILSARFSAFASSCSSSDIFIHQDELREWGRYGLMDETHYPTAAGTRERGGGGGLLKPPDDAQRVQQNCEEGTALKNKRER